MKKKDNYQLGTWVQMNSSTVIEIIGQSKFDFIVIDLEHGNISLESLEQLLRAAECSGLKAIVRVYENNASLIMRVLDLGPDGVLIPHVSSKKEAEKAVQFAKYPPIGTRGSCPCIREADHWSNNWPEFMKKSNNDTMVVALVEGQDGIENFGEIVEVDGIDAFMIGPFDLSVSLGIPGQTTHPSIEETYSQVIEQTKKHGKELIGVDFSYDLQDIESSLGVWSNRGVSMIMTGIDKMFFTKIVQEVGELKISKGGDGQ